MIKLLKLQKAVYVILAGFSLSLLYWLFEANNVKGVLFIKIIAGALLVIGSVWFLYPILWSKDDGDGKVDIITDPTVEEKESDL
ncbi:hypothetical protein [Pedobacter sp. MW01-1-1]|uniref:hypothetical protein n=1 Tax=Pedobacter sp. MW01-1-1 TaxID=3383027 RepID=UPI003FEF8638